MRNDGSGDDPGDDDDASPVANSRSTRFSAIWLIPVIALVVAVFLGYRAVSSRGELITITFQSADGLSEGQTQVKHKNVGLGTVEGVHLTDDMRQVNVHVRMNREADHILTTHARFWVVRPRLSGSNISGLETLVSGAYIAVDPGTPGGTPTTTFRGLDSPPGVRSDEPGRTYTAMTGSIGALGEGSPVFFRGVSVGEVLGYQMPPDGRGPIPVQVFVKEPYDHFVRIDTRFWNASGVQVSFGGGGLHLQLESLQAVLSGGVAFGLPEDRRGIEEPEAPDQAVFKLYPDHDEADSAGYHQRIPFATYLDSSVSGLTAGSRVDMYGIQIGNVTDVQLQLDARNGTARVRVAMEVQPERAFSSSELHGETPQTIASRLVANGMRAQLSSASFITGSSLIAFQFVPNARPAQISMEGDVIVLPSQKGGLSGITDSLSDVAAKLDQLPIESIASHLDGVLAGASDTVNSPDLKKAVHQLSGTLKSIGDLADHANKGMTPVLQKLPALTDQLEATLHHANSLLSSYSGGSDFQNNLQRLMGQLNDMARSLRLLSDFLTRHPNALIFGRSAPGRHN